MKALFAAIILLLSSNTFAQAVSVNVFQPLAGGAPRTVAYFREAREILEEAGAQVAISSDLSGTYRFAVAFPNWEAYGNWAQSLASNKDWASFQAKTAKTPSAMQISNVLLNTISATPGGGPGTVTQVTVWKITTGTMAALVEGGRMAKPIHEKSGARVSIYGSGGNMMYYLQNFDNMAAWGKNRDTPNPEFNAFMQSQTAANNGSLGAEIVDQFTLNNL
jgi:hypothetical protein